MASPRPDVFPAIVFDQFDEVATLQKSTRRNGPILSMPVSPRRDDTDARYLGLMTPAQRSMSAGDWYTYPVAMRKRVGKYREPGRAGTPCNIPSTLMSSSISGQRIPTPRPRIWKSSRCRGVALERRHDQLSGTLMVRPSASWAVMASSETGTARIAGWELIAMLIASIHCTRKARLYQLRICVNSGRRSRRSSPTSPAPTKTYTSDPHVERGRGAVHCNRSCRNSTGTDPRYS